MPTCILITAKKGNTESFAVAHSALDLQSKLTLTGEFVAMTVEWAKAIVGVTLMTGIAGTAGALELTPGRILSFHSESSSGCPGLDWHIVVAANNQLKGMISWDDMHDIARVTGSANPDGRFHLVFPGMKGSGKGGSIEGQFPDYNGYLTAHVVGAGCPQQDVKVEWFRSPGAGSPNG